MAAPSVVARKKTKKTDTGCIVGKETIPVIKYVNQCTMHICGMDFSSLASYWQIKALLMLEPSVVTPQNQYFPANSERMSVHCLESGCIGKYTHLGPRDFPRAGILHPSALEIALGQSLGPRGAKSPPLGNLLGLGECIFQYIPPLGSVRIQYFLSDRISFQEIFCALFASRDEY